MRKFILGLLLVAGVVGVWQFIESGEMDRFTQKVGVSLGGERRHGPSWGDVAEKVGEFADAERGLKQTVASPEAPGDKAGAN